MDIQIINLLKDYTFQVVGFGAMALGVICGISGSFAVLRKQSLLGDSIAHSSLAGVALAYMMTLTRSTTVLLVGALLFGMISTFIIQFFSKNTRVNFESSLALVMSSLFGLGLVLLTQIQKMPSANQAGLEKFLFGQAATILKSDVVVTVIVMVLVIATVLLFYKELKIYTFDPIFTKTSGFNTRVLEVILSAFVVASVIMGIQMVGVVLISALLIVPAVAARQWTNRFSTMIVLASLIGAVSGFVGTLLSSLISKFPTGPAIVLVASSIVTISLLFAPQRGILNKTIRRNQARISFKSDMMLIHYFVHHNHPIESNFSIVSAYESMQEDRDLGLSLAQVKSNLLQRGYIERKGDSFILTSVALTGLFEGGMM